MSSFQYFGIGVLTLMFMGGCESMPTVTRTGEVKAIILGENLSVADIVVNTGDEIRWINKRTVPIRIVLLDRGLNEKLSCKNNFGAWMSRSDTAYLATNGTASVCFWEVGLFRYTVSSGITPGEIDVPGVIKVGGKQGDAAMQTSEQGKHRTSGQAGNRLSELMDGESSGPISAVPRMTSTIMSTTTPPAK